MALKNIQAHLLTNNDKNDVMSNIAYICKSCSLITDALQKGCDVMQLADGTIIVTEMKAVTFQYAWDDKKGKLIRLQTGARTKKGKIDKIETKNKSKKQLETA